MPPTCKMEGCELRNLIWLTGIHVGLDATADLPIAKLKKQLDVNLVAQVSVTQVSTHRANVTSVYPSTMLQPHFRERG